MKQVKYAQYRIIRMLMGLRPFSSSQLSFSTVFKDFKKLFAFLGYCVAGKGLDFQTMF